MDIAAELEAHTANLKAVGGVEPYVTQKQVRRIVSLMSEVAPDRKTRIAILKLIAGPAMKSVAGVDIKSTKNLTGRMASYLIDQLADPRSTTWNLSSYGQRFLEAAKAQVESLAEARAG